MYKILIVEDDCPHRELLNDFLIDCGYQTILAKDGRDGFNQLQKHRPHLVILDICMPTHNGFYFLGEVQKLKDQTPVFAMSSKPAMKDAPELRFARQVKHFFTKPLHLLELKNLAEQWLKQTPSIEKNNGSLKKRLLRNSKTLIGSFFADCRIEKLLGKGASGVVYQGHHLGLDIPVAIKILNPRHDRSPQERQRFLREANILTRLEHKNLIQILNAGIKDELYFMVMRYIDGVTLDVKLRDKGKLELPLAVPIILQVAQALQVAHDTGLIHRDVKPSNILLSRDGERVVVIDFGLARDFKKPADVTDKNLVVGTPYYMSPEQCLGVALNHQTDIYSLGATFYHLIIGAPPFDKENAIDTMLAHTGEIPVAPHELDNSIPVAISSIIMQMLKKAPSQRQPDMKSVIKDLQATKKFW